MPLPPAFTIDGVLPPFTGPQGPGDDPAFMSPYIVTASEVVSRLGTDENRRGILVGWLKHRAALRSLGFVRGFQWLDGSFLENKVPQDLDTVTFLHRPSGIQDGADLLQLMRASPHLFIRDAVKSAYKLDAFFIDLQGNPETLVSISRYFLGLFSHQRDTFLWKGMAQVRLEDPVDDAAAIAALGAASGVAGDAP